jgi:hypothetical protein
MYANAYNKNIANRLKDNDKKLIQHQEESNKMTDTSFTSHLEGMALRDEDVVGGSGYAEATVRDEGFEGENTEGARGSGEPNDPPAKKTRKPRKSKEVGGAILGLAEIETDPRGDPSLKAPLEKTAPSASKEHTQTAPVTTAPTTPHFFNCERKPPSRVCRASPGEATVSFEDDDAAESDADVFRGWGERLTSDMGDSFGQRQRSPRTVSV